MTKVITLLNDEQSPITKKEACAVLNISYNTARLQRIIEEHLARVALRKKRVAEKRGKPATKDEIAEIVTGYLKGEALVEIASGVFRSSSFVKNIIQTVGVPSRKLEEEEWKTEYLPDACVATDFEKDEVVWSAKYHKPAIIVEELSTDYQAEKMGFGDINYPKKYASNCYKIYVLTGEDLEDYDSKRLPGFNAYSLGYDLGKLAHLEEFGVNLRTI